MAQILIFGDSIPYGAWDLEGGWVARLRRFLDSKVINSKLKDYYITYNLGVSVDTTSDLLERFEREVNARLDKTESDTIIIFSIGGNDSAFLTKEKKFLTEISKFEKNIKELIKKAKDITDKIILIGEIPHDESKTTPVAWDSNINYKNEYLNKYENVTRKICKEQNIHFIDLFGKLINTNYKANLEDGVHPTSEGHRQIFNIIKEDLIKNKML